MPAYKILIYREGQPLRSLSLDEAIEIGRMDPKIDDPAPVEMRRLHDSLRLVIAEPHQVTIPRHWFKVVPRSEDKFEVINFHGESSVILANDLPIPPRQARTYGREILLHIGTDLALRIEPTPESTSSDHSYRTLDSIPPTPGQDVAIPTLRTIHQFPASDAAEISKMLRIALQVVQKAADSDAFFQAAVVAAAEIVDLDQTVLLLRKEAAVVARAETADVLPDGWCIIAEHQSSSRPSPGQIKRVSTSLLMRVMQSRATVVHDTLGGLGEVAGVESLQQVECAVASPILNDKREVIGALYGHRSRGAAVSGATINDVDAALVEILAGSVAGGIARCAEIKLRSTLSGFFSSKVANQLASDPTLMEGQDAQVSVLFCDVRGFSGVTEKLGPQKAIAWINDVMSELSGCVLERDGVLVDYVGDELLAMWGVPGSQPNHATLAIDSARAMIKCIETLRDRWADVLPGRFGAGIGINSGPARVGNVGSRQKFKYGPLGNTVNVGSRLQSATKQLGVTCIASHATVSASSQIESVRRLGKIGVLGIDEPIEVYEITESPTENWTSMAASYHEALDHFESCRFHEAARVIGALMPQHPTDVPSRKLLARILFQMDESGTDFDGVWKLTSK